MQVIQLYGGKGECFVSNEDFERLSEYRWLASKLGYVRRLEWVNKKQKTFLMHREVLGAAPGEIVDHLNMNPLDNRRENLRIANKAQNSMNRVKQVGKYTSKYKGVYKARKPWRAHICVDDKYISLGVYFTEIEAAKAYNDAAIKYFGKFARLNEICETK